MDERDLALLVFAEGMAVVVALGCYFAAGERHTDEARRRSGDGSRAR
jgi:hypothetical protein